MSSRHRKRNIVELEVHLNNVNRIRKSDVPLRPEEFLFIIIFVHAVQLNFRISVTARNRHEYTQTRVLARELSREYLVEDADKTLLIRHGFCNHLITDDHGKPHGLYLLRCHMSVLNRPTPEHTPRRASNKASTAALCKPHLDVAARPSLFLKSFPNPSVCP